MKDFWEGFEKRADSTMDARRRALLQVREILAPHGDFIAVSEGASVSRTTKPGVIKDLRLKLMDYERSRGEDPTHDWRKKYAGDPVKEWTAESKVQPKRSKEELRQRPADPVTSSASYVPDTYWRSWP